MPREKLNVQPFEKAPAPKKPELKSVPMPELSEPDKLIDIQDINFEENPAPKKPKSAKLESAKLESAPLPENFVQTASLDEILLSPNPDFQSLSHKYEGMQNEIVKNHADEIAFARKISHFDKMKNEIAEIQAEIKKIPEDIEDKKAGYTFKDRMELGQKKVKLNKDLQSRQKQCDEFEKEIVKLKINENIKTGKKENLHFKQFQLARLQMILAHEMENVGRQIVDLDKKLEKLIFAAALKKPDQQMSDDFQLMALENKKKHLMADLNWDESEFKKNEIEINDIQKQTGEKPLKKPAAQKSKTETEPLDLTHMKLEEVSDDEEKLYDEDIIEVVDNPSKTKKAEQPQPIDLTSEIEEDTPEAEPAAKAGESPLKKELKMDLQRAMREFDDLSEQLDEAKVDLQKKYAQHGRGVLGFGKNQAVKQAEKKFTNLSEDVEEKKKEIKKIQKNIDRA
ncbi:MAG: hypothetical protein V1928_02400 [Parcubacteria group bacterium]